MKQVQLQCNREELFDINMMITFSLVINRSYNHEQLEKAFIKAVSLHEILNTRIVLDEAGTAFYQPCNRPSSNIQFTDLSLPDLINQQEKIRFHVEEGEFVRLFVNDSKPNELQLHFLAHHTSGDGESLCYFAESFLKCLAGEEVSYTEMVLMKKENIPKDIGLTLVNLLTSIMNCFRKRKVFGFNDLEKAYQTFWINHQTELILEEINQEQLTSILDNCHNYQVSFTSHYIGELLKGQQEKKRLGIAQNKRTNGIHQMGNQVTGFGISYHYNNKFGFWDNVQRIHKKLQKQIHQPLSEYFALCFTAALHPTLVDGALMESVGLFHSPLTHWLSETIGYGKKGNRGYRNLSNLGVCDIQSVYSDFVIKEMRFIPPNVSYAKDVIGIITLNGKCYISRRKYKEN